MFDISWFAILIVSRGTISGILVEQNQKHVHVGRRHSGYARGVAQGLGLVLDQFLAGLSAEGCDGGVVELAGETHVFEPALGL